MSDILAGRATTSFPISIGSSLALESLFSPRQSPYDLDRKIPEMVDLYQYDELWINVNTLFRNMYTSIDASDAEQISYQVYTEYILDEMSTIESLMHNEGRNACKVIFYHCVYDKLIKRLSGKPIDIRKPNTSKQMIYYSLLNSTIELLMKQRSGIQKHDTSFGNDKRVLIMTNYAPDLLNYKRFNKLDLLESHTGLVKNKLTFFTKYATKNLPPLPFLTKLLAIFGDSEIVKPAPVGVRTMIIDLANKYKWSPVTTEAKVLFDIDLHITDLPVKQLIKYV